MKKKFLSVVSIILSVFLIALTGCNCGGNSDMSIKYLTEASDVSATILAGKYSVGILPEPLATITINKAKTDEKTLYKLSLGDLYDNELKSYPQAVMLIREDVVSPTIVSELTEKINMGVEWLLQSQANITTAITKLKTLGSTLTNMPLLAVKGSNINFKDTTSSKQSVIKIINEMREIDSNIIATNDDYFYNMTSSGSSIKETISIGVPDGAPALSIGKLAIDDTKICGKSVDIKVVNASEIGACITRDKLDIVILPVSDSTRLYNINTDVKYKMAGVVTNGNLFLVSDFEIKNEELKSKLTDKTLALFKQGTVPDIMTKIVLKKYNISYKVVD